jgi:Trk K+ transport system NAD-binding subunit
LAELLGGRLRRDGEVVTFIGTDEQRLTELHRAGFRVVTGYPAEARLLQEAGAAHARALITVANAPEIVLPACRLAQERFAIPTIIARADDARLIEQLQHLHIRVVQPIMATALALEAALRFPEAFNMLLDQTDEVDMLDVPLRNQALMGRPLRYIRLPGDALVLGMRRQGDIVVPHGDTVLQPGDTLMLVGSPDALQQSRQWLEGRQGRAASEASP